MKIYYNTKLKRIARNLRNDSTLSEVLFWNKIKGKSILGYQFLRQKPIGNFIVDFYCNKLKLAIEIDGDSHGFEESIQNDKIKENHLSRLGVDLIRYSDQEVKINIVGVINHLVDWIEKKEKENC